MESNSGPGLRSSPFQSYGHNTSKYVRQPVARNLAKITYLTEAVLHLGGRRIGRLETDSNLGSEANFDIAKSWLSGCREEHSEGLQDDPKLPTRVIDVGVAGNSAPPRIIVSKGVKAPYIALSHCWGGHISLVLSTETLRDFRQELPVGRLAQNFQDAIAIARQLGFRYLWIDCLCILQDSKSDWASESKLMGQIYRDSTLTVFALSSRSSTTGILHTNVRREAQLKRAKVRVFSDTYRHEYVSVSGHGELESMRGLEMSAALQQRGWTLQEWSLSRRHLYYGNDQIYWQCHGSYKSSDDLPMGIQFPHRTFDTMSSVFHSGGRGQQKLTPDESMRLLSEYYHIVEQYSRRDLTYAIDKLPALSGLCERLHQVIPGEFVAGLWSCDLHRGLLWFADGAFSKHVTPYRAPSWSWAVTDESVLYDYSTDEMIVNDADLDLEVFTHTVKLLNPEKSLWRAKLRVNGCSRLVSLSCPEYAACSRKYRTGR